MPTYQRLPRFDQDWRNLDKGEQERFWVAVAHFVDDLESGRALRPGLRVKKVRGAAEVMEMTFSPDGRATWQFGAEITPGQAHVVWRRIGTHVFRAP